MEPNEVIQIREHLGLSHDGLGDVLGVHRSTVQRWERGVVPVPKATAIALRALKAAQPNPAPKPQPSEAA